MIILGIETSCDETAVAVVKAEKSSITVLSNIVSSQVKLHTKWGGVVPNLAAREHLKNILPVLEESLKKAKVSPKKIDLIAVTEGPGLIPALIIGVDSAKTLSYLWKKPMVGIHHIEGHIYANFINEIRVNSKSEIQNSKQIINSKNQNPKKSTSYKLQAIFPILCLVVSGGHTQLVLMKKHLDYKIIGETQDDAAGEAFDKVARILKLGYPGGPAISACADEFRISNLEFRNKSKLKNSKFKIDSKFKIQNSKFSIVLPRPMLNSKDFNFSFSGLKTAVLYKVKQLGAMNDELRASLAHEFQQAAIDVLVSKTVTAAKKLRPKTIMLAGGVSANTELRKQLKKAIKENSLTVDYEIPEMSYTGDNAAMIATASYFRFQNIKNKNRLINNWRNLEADAGLKLK